MRCHSSVPPLPSNVNEIQRNYRWPDSLVGPHSSPLHQLPLRGDLLGDRHLNNCEPLIIISPGVTTDTGDRDTHLKLPIRELLHKETFTENGVADALSTSQCGPHVATPPIPLTFRDQVPLGAARCWERQQTHTPWSPGLASLWAWGGGGGWGRWWGEGWPQTCSHCILRYTAWITNVHWITLRVQNHTPQITPPQRKFPLLTKGCWKHKSTALVQTEETMIVKVKQ